MDTIKASNMPSATQHIQYLFIFNDQHSLPVRCNAGLTQISISRCGAFHHRRHKRKFYSDTLLLQLCTYLGNDQLFMSAYELCKMFHPQHFGSNQPYVAFPENAFDLSSLVIALPRGTLRLLFL